MLRKFRLSDKLSNKNSIYLWLFLLTWLLINFFQSAFTELAHDEAYYWMYSRYLDWGYFDHPPVIALLIRLGYFLLPDEFGVRLLTSVMGTATIYIIYLLIDEEKRSLGLFVLLCFSIILVQSHVGGFLAIPDVPVVFFSALFLLIYKRYLKKDSYFLAILLGITGIAMLMSKYHGILILVFSLFAYLNIIHRRSFWIIPVVIILGMLPHLMWQIHHGFPSLKYHLLSRSSSYRFEHTFNYLYSQLLIAGPLVSILVLYAGFTYKAENLFEKTLKYNMIGIFVFFFLSSFKGHVEAHWTALAFIPLMVLANNRIRNSKIMKKWVSWLFVPSILLISFVRFAAIVQIFPGTVLAANELHNWPKWAHQIDSLSEGRKVVFTNSFQRPAKFSFYTHGKFATTLNNIYYRKNQYDIWDFEDSLQHQKVLLVQSRTPQGTIKTAVGESYHYQMVDDFMSYNNLKITANFDRIETYPDTKFTFIIKLLNTRNDSVIFKKESYIISMFHDGHKLIQRQILFKLDNTKLGPSGDIAIPLVIKSPIVPGKYKMLVSIITSNLDPGFNSPAFTLVVKNN